MDSNGSRLTCSAKAILNQAVMLKSLQIGNYRSFDKEGVQLSQLEKINIIIGKNNSGKSNVLRFLDILGKSLPIKSGNKIVGLDLSVDRHNLNHENQIEFRLVPILKKEFTEKADMLPYEGDCFFSYKISSNLEIELFDSFLHAVDEEKIRSYVNSSMGRSGGEYSDRLKDAIGGLKLEDSFVLPTVVYIDEFRKLSGDEDLKKQISNTANVSFKELELKGKHERLEEFVSEILGEKLEIQVPNLQSGIELIYDNGQQFPLGLVGTGVHEVILLAFHLTRINKAIVCIDEPELHLHPGIQRAFLKYVSEYTDHQYFISTHSNAFLDHEVEKAIYEVKLVNRITKIQKRTKLKEVHDILDDLGIRASEILQTNGIIWVEGPSDRIYIKKWLELARSEFNEGFNYTFQFYGGSLLTHYSVEDVSFKEFVNLSTINTNSFIVMDSDMEEDYKETELRANKRKIIEECKKNGKKYWVTAGREIENYLSESVLTEFSKKVAKRTQYEKIETYSKYNRDKKVSESRKIIKLMNSSEIDEAGYDLKEKIEELKSCIDSWNR